MTDMTVSNDTSRSSALVTEPAGPRDRRPQEARFRGTIVIAGTWVSGLSAGVLRASPSERTAANAPVYGNATLLHRITQAISSRLGGARRCARRKAVPTLPPKAAPDINLARALAGAWRDIEC